MSFRMIFLIGIAGAAGTLLRCGILKLLADPLKSGFPVGTLLVNVAGAFLAGFCFVLFRQKYPQLQEYLPVIMIGFLGALTTFSTYSLESASLFSDGSFARALLNILLQNSAGIAAVFAGFQAARLLG